MIAGAEKEENSADIAKTTQLYPHQPMNTNKYLPNRKS